MTRRTDSEPIRPNPLFALDQAESDYRQVHSDWAEYMTTTDVLQRERIKSTRKFLMVARQIRSGSIADARLETTTAEGGSLKIVLPPLPGVFLKEVTRNLAQIREVDPSISDLGQLGESPTPDTTQSPATPLR